MRADEAEGYRQEADGYSPTPLVVLDTVPATVALSDENANSEVSAAVAALRAGIGDASLWATMHVAKALKFSEGEDLSARGAGAWAADTTGEIFVALPPKQDPDDPPPTTRFVSLGKRRFEPTTSLYEVHTQVSEEAIDTPWGQRQTALYRTVSLMQAVTPEERREQRQRARSARQEDDLRARMMVMMTRAKRALESCEGEGLAVARTAGRAQPPPGYARWSLEDVMMGKRSSEVRGELVAALVEAYRPAEEEHFYLFKKPTFGMGKK